MRNFQPLPDQTYSHLRAEAQRALAPEPIDSSLRQQLRQERHDRMAAYAAEMAGTVLDLDPDLESAGIEYLAQTWWT
ncbi:MAG: hypothetical protein ABSG65_19830 [Bryobacteraceae bacterium]|jgi:hypothetical protein